MELPRSKHPGETKDEFERSLQDLVRQIVSREFSEVQAVNSNVTHPFELGHGGNTVSSHSSVSTAGTSHSSVLTAGTSHSSVSTAGTSHSSVLTAGTSHSSVSTAGTSHPATPTASQTVPKTYKKRPGVADGAGESYEYKMLTLVYLGLVEEPQEFQLASNMEVAGAFDDIVMRYRKQSSDSWKTCCVQLKHKQTKGKGIPEIEFLSLTGDFSLVKYSASFALVKSSVCKELDSSDEPFLILYTNANIPADLVDEIDCVDEILCTGGKVVSFKPDGKVYQGLCDLVDFKEELNKLKDDVAGLSAEKVKNRIHDVFDKVEYKNKAVTSWRNELLKTSTLAKLQDLLKKLGAVSDKEMYSAFLKEFQVYTGQANESELDDMIKEKLNKIWKNSKIFDKLLGGVQSWWKKDNKYLTQNSPLWLDLIKLQTWILSKATVAGLTKTGVEFEERSLKEIYGKIIKSEGILHLRVDSRTAASSLRVHQALARFGVLNVLHVNVKELFAREDDVLSAWATRWCRVLVLQCDKKLYRKKATRVREKILKVNNGKKLLVLIGPKEHELNVQLQYSDSYTSLHDNGNWYNLTEDTKRKIFSQKFVMNGSRSNTTLLDLLGEDKGFIGFVNKVNMEVISQFIRGDFCFGKDLDKEGKHFVTRQLQDSAGGDSFVVNSVGDVPGKVVLVVAEPGMGKSMLLTHLAQSAKTEDSSAWIVHIKLNECWQLLKDIKQENFNEFDAMKFLEDAALNSINSMEKFLFMSLPKIKLVVFVDGVDEVCPHYKTEVFTLLRSLRDMEFSKLFVASRPVFREDLEDTLRVKTHLLVAFSNENQKEFFNKVRKQQNPSATEEECNNWTEKLLTWLTESLGEDNPIMGVPLMNAMIAETFQDRDFRSSETLDVFSLYRNFVEKKFDLYCVEKKNTPNRDQAVELDIEKNLKKRMHHTHRLAALQILFSPEEISTLEFEGKESFENDLTAFLKEVSDGTEKIGIIDNVIDGDPQFVHQSFAEFFVASLLASCFKENRKLLERVLFDSVYGLVAKMFHWSLAGNRPLHVAVLKRDVEATKGLLTNDKTSDVNEKDDGGRTPLHLAVILIAIDQLPDSITILKLLLQDSRVLLDVPDKVLGWGPLEYAEIPRNWMAIQTVSASGKHILKHVEGLKKPDPLVMLDAARNAPLPVVRYLAEVRRGKLDCKGPEGETIVHKAAARDDVDVLEYLSTKNLSLVKKDHNGNTALHYASKQCVQFLLALAYDLESVNNEGLTVLQVSSLDGEYDKMAALLDAKASYQPRNNKPTELQLNASFLCAAFVGDYKFMKRCYERIASMDTTIAKTSWNYPSTLYKEGRTGSKEFANGDTPFYKACREDDLDFMSFILSRGADVDLRGWKGETPLFMAAAWNKLAVATMLLEKGVNVDCRDVEDSTLLHVALREGSKQVADLLLSYGADFNVVNKQGETMLHLAACSDNNLAVATMLLEKGANVDCPDVEDNTPLHVALQRGSKQVTELLLRHGADVNAINKQGQTILHLASRSDKNLAVATMLLVKGANVDCRDVEDNTPLHVALQRGSKKVAELLLRHGADVNAVNKQGQTMLHIAAQSDYNLAVATMLLVKGANVDCPDVKGNTPLHGALEWGSKKVAELLLRHGADVTAVNKRGETMLHKFAQTDDNLAVASMLLEKGVNVDCRDVEDNTPLHFALRWGSKKATELLLRHGADVNAVNKQGETMLDLAAQSDNLGVATMLLENGANVDCRDVEGNTPLHVASQSLWGREKVADLLLRRGADVNAVNKNGQTPLSIAIEKGNSNMVTLLKAKGARMT